MQLMAYWEPTGGQGDIDTGLCTPREVRAAVPAPRAHKDVCLRLTTSMARMRLRSGVVSG